MWSCCKSRKAPAAERQPLLQHTEDETTLQHRLRDKLRTYEMIQALSQGFLPSTNQLTVHLRALISSDLLNPDNPTLSLSGRQLARDCRAIIRIFIGILHEKNGDDYLQEFIWQFSQSKASLDVADLERQASSAKAHADTAAAYDSLRTVGRLLLTNADFRRVANDLTTVGRAIYSDAAASLSTTAGEVSEGVAPSDEQRRNLSAASSDRPGAADTNQAQQDIEQVKSTTKKAVENTTRDTAQSARQHLSGEQKNALLSTLKRAITNLRKRNDYTTSVSTLSELIQRYGRIYSLAIDTTVGAAIDDVDVNPELNRAIRNFWKFLGSFGSRSEWQALEDKFHRLIQNSEKSPAFKTLVDDLAVAVHRLLLEPSALDSADGALGQLRTKCEEIYSEDSRQAVDDFLQQASRTIQSVSEDRSILKLTTAAKKFANDFSVAYNKDYTTIPADALHIFLPHLLRAIQHIPIPRIEISEPEMDLLLENVVLEPGHTVRNSSFLPFRVAVSTKSDMELRKTHSKEATTGMTNIVTISMYGLNISAKEFGYWIRVHSPPFIPYVGDEGLASFILDERGIDISLDVEIGRERLEQILQLRAVRVTIHKLDYTVSQSAWTGLLWLLKPFLKHMIRRILEKKIAEQIVATFHVINRELIFARERLRAARISNPADIITFIHAVQSRMSGRPDPDIYTRIGIDAHRKGVFKGVYAPGSLVKMAHEEQRRTEEAIDSGAQTERSWRNAVFDYVPFSSRRGSRS